MLRGSLIALIFCYIPLVSEENSLDSKIKIKEVGTSTIPVGEEKDSNDSFLIQSFQFQGLQAFSPEVLKKTLQDFRNVPRLFQI